MSQQGSPFYSAPIPQKPPKPIDPDCCDGCTKIGYQYADVSVPVELKPNVKIGKIETECCGEPLVCCTENPAGKGFEALITQKICIKIPIKYNVCADIGETQVNCDCGDCGK